MSSKSKRQNKIKEILTGNSISHHDDLIKLLKEQGILVTQATLSRDFSDMGVIRTISEEGTPRYILNPEESGRQIMKFIGFEILAVQHNESLIVVRTLAGRAQGVAYYIDRLNKPEILGTVAGDDTVLIIPNSNKNIAAIIEMIEKLITI
jgi:transcriptional regulator of arginine metabolism